MRSFYGFLMAEGRIKEDPTEHLSSPKQRNHPVTMFFAFYWFRYVLLVTWKSTKDVAALLIP